MERRYAAGAAVFVACVISFGVVLLLQVVAVPLLAPGLNDGSPASTETLTGVRLIGMLVVIGIAFVPLYRWFGRLGATLCPNCLAEEPADADGFCPKCGVRRPAAGVAATRLLEAVPGPPGNPTATADGRADGAEPEPAISPQGRAARVDLISTMLGGALLTGAPIHVTFRGNVRDSGIIDVPIRVTALPGGRVRADVQIRPPHARELDPEDADEVGDLVDAIAVYVQASAVPRTAEWVARLAPDATAAPDEPEAAGATETGRDGEWNEVTGDEDLRKRLRWLTLHDGRQLTVRYADGPTTELLLVTRRRGERWEVRASDLGAVDGTATGWRQRWTVTRNQPDAPRILADLRGALDNLSPPGAGGKVAIGIRRAEGGSVAYSGVVGWMAAFALIGVLAFLDGYLGPVLRDDFPDGGRIAQIILVAMTSVLYATVAGNAVADLADRFWLPPLPAQAAAELAGAVVTLALVGVLAVAGASWGIALALTWVIPIALLGVVRVVRGH